MFDHLDDSSAPTPGPEELASVQRRAGRLRWRRRAVVAGPVASIAVVTTVVALTVGGGAHRTSSQSFLTVASPSSSDSATPTESSTSSSSPTAVPTTPPQPLPTDVVSSPPTVVTPSPHPTCAGFPADCPDGKPGWFSGFTSCSVATPVAAKPDAGEVFRGFTAELLPPATIVPGAYAPVVLRLHNTTTFQLSVDLQGTVDTTLPMYGPGGGSAVHTTDAISSPHLDLPPGGSVDESYRVAAATCGDTSNDPEPPLSAGTYRIGLGLGYTNAHWQTATASPSSSPGPSPAPTHPADPKDGSVDFSAPVRVGN